LLRVHDGLADLRHDGAVGARDDRPAGGVLARLGRRRREHARHRVDERRDPDVLLRAADQHRDDLIVRAVVAEVALDLVLRRFFAVEQLFHERIVEVGQRLEQDRALCFDRVADGDGDLDLAGLGVAVEVCFTRREVDVAAEAVTDADGQVRRHDVRTVRRT
jgi:hypothetical protein